MKSLAVLVVLAAVACSGDDSFAQGTAPFAWGVCGHPTWWDYAEWVPGNMQKQVDLIRQLGCSYYRCSFEGGSYPAILHNIVPPAQAAGVTVLPDLPMTIVAAADAKTNYLKNYQNAYQWASYAISMKYQLPYWELGNELENWNLVKVDYDGTGPDEFPDKKPGGFVAIASSLSGAYRGIKDAYAGGRARGETDIVPQILYGCCYHHWGLLTRILNYNGSLPCDIISWHWYEPNCGPFNAPIHDGKSFSNGRTPAECLGDFKSGSNPGQPMDVWITELNRSVHTPQGLLNGSFSDHSPQGQDWDAEAKEIQATIEDVKKAPNVKGVFVYELLDEPMADGKDPKHMRSEGNYGLLTGLSGTRKDAFYTYQNEIKANH